MIFPIISYIFPSSLRPGLALAARASPPEPNSVGGSRVEPTEPGGWPVILNSPVFQERWLVEIPRFLMVLWGSKVVKLRWGFWNVHPEACRNDPNLTMIFQMGWSNHRRVFVHFHLVFTGKSSMLFFANGWNAPFFLDLHQGWGSVTRGQNCWSIWAWSIFIHNVWNRIGWNS